MTKLYFAVHQIEDENGVHLNEVFEPVAGDLEAFQRVGAVREPTETELAFYKLTKGDPVKAEQELKKAAEAARAAATKAAEKATKAETDAAAKPADDKLKEAAAAARAAATAADETATKAETAVAGGTDSDFS